MAKGAPWELEIMAFSASTHLKEEEARIFSVNKKGYSPAGRGAPGRWGRAKLKGTQEVSPSSKAQIYQARSACPGWPQPPEWRAMADGLLL